MSGSVTAAARARAHLALRQRRRLGAAVDAVDPGTIPDGMTFRGWCEKLGREGLMIDRKPFRLDNRPALLPLYDAIPTTREEAFLWTLAVQKATQLGLTVWEVLADIYMAKKWGPVNIGLYLPDQSTAAFKSHHRFMPIVRSAPLLYRELLARPAGEGRGGEGNVMTRQFGNSLLLFMWTSGRSSTESRPCDVVSLDEVQNMSLAEIDKVRARMGDSEVRFTLLLSTANMPEADINEWYLRGTQEVWHTRCAHCGALADLSEPAGGIFPAKSIGFSGGRNFAPIRCDDPERLAVLNDDRRTSGRAPLVVERGLILPPRDEHVWTCPTCEQWIADAQLGEYVCQNPSGWDEKIRSWLLPRTISPRITPGEMARDFRNARTGDQRKSFWNRTLARPYVDLDQLPVTLEHCQAAATEGKRAGLLWEAEAQPGASYYLGLDQMAGWIAAIVKKRLPDGRSGVVHVAALEDTDPWGKARDLMDRFRISVCVVEQLPDANGARAFANAFPGRVFLNTSFVSADMVSWSDLQDRSERKTAEEARERYQVGVNQYKLMQWSLLRVRDRQTLFPDPDELPMVEVPGALLPRKKTKKRGGEDDEGVADARLVNICREIVFDHFTKTALVVQQDEVTRKPKAFVMKIGLDPHFSYANMLCDAAWAREHGTGTIFIPTAAPLPANSVAPAVVAGPTGAPVQIPRPVDNTPRGTCGACTHFIAARAFCNERKMGTGAREHACMMFEGVG